MQLKGCEVESAIGADNDAITRENSSLQKNYFSSNPWPGNLYRTLLVQKHQQHNFVHQTLGVKLAFDSVHNSATHGIFRVLCIL